MTADSEINNCEHEQLLSEARDIRDKNLISGVIKRTSAKAMNGRLMLWKQSTL